MEIAKTPTILLVEDQALIAAGEARVLEDHGFRVITAYTGEDAVAALEADAAIDLVLMDIDLGRGMDGTEAARRILERRDLPLVFLSSHSEREVVERTEGITSYGYVVKAVEDVVLVTSIRMALRLFEARRRERETMAALRASEARFRMVVENSKDGINILDLRKGQYFFMSPTQVALTGFTQEEMQNLSVEEAFERVHPEDREISKAQQEHVAAGAESPTTVEYRWKVKSGEYRWFSDSRTLVRDEEGEPVALVGVSRDITDRKALEQALRDSEARFRLALKNSPITVFNQDRELRYTWVYNALPKVRPEDILGRIDEDLLPPPEAARLTAVKRRVLETGEAARAEVQLTLDGHTSWFDLNVEALRGEDGEICGVTCASVDVTERQRTEAALRAAVAEKEVLLREVHHRVKNNLASIQSLIRLQRESCRDAKQVAEWDALGARVQAMLLVHQLLYQSEAVDRVDMHQYLTKLVANLRTAYPRSAGVDARVAASGVEMDLDTAIPCGLIVSELATNAFKYAFPQGKPRPGAERCELSVNLTQDGRAYRLEVSDNGVGRDPSASDLAAAPTIGLRLVDLLGRGQLGSSIDVRYSDGVSYRFEFPRRTR